MQPPVPVRCSSCIYVLLGDPLAGNLVCTVAPAGKWVPPEGVILVDHALIDGAAKSLGIVDLSPFGPSAQKYVARARRGSEEVVLKVVELTGPHRNVTLERARREVDLLSRINHDNVLRVLTGLKEIGGRPVSGVAWLEEYLEGEDLRDRLTSQWAWENTPAMALEVAP